jgi:hypothetical protein
MRKLNRVLDAKAEQAAQRAGEAVDKANTNPMDQAAQAAANAAGDEAAQAQRLADRHRFNRVDATADMDADGYWNSTHRELP